MNDMSGRFSRRPQPAGSITLIVKAGDDAEAVFDFTPPTDGKKYRIYFEARSGEDLHIWMHPDYMEQVK